MEELRLRRDDLSWRELDGEIVALDNGESVYLATNRAGTLIWRKLAEGTTRADLVDELVATFAIDPERATTDVDTFVGDLQAKGLLER
jgi:hypothetical protein